MDLLRLFDEKKLWFLTLTLQEPCLIKQVKAFNIKQIDVNCSIYGAESQAPQFDTPNAKNEFEVWNF